MVSSSKVLSPLSEKQMEIISVMVRLCSNGEGGPWSADEILEARFTNPSAKGAAEQDRHLASLESGNLLRRRGSVRIGSIKGTSNGV